jgi:peptide/nickel transport system ATP-binding protein
MSTAPDTMQPARDMAVPDPVLQVDGLSIEFAAEHGWTRVTEDVSFSVARGETLGIVGESGSGKTVTAMAIMGLLPKAGSRQTGSVMLEGTELLSLDRAGLDEVRGDRIAMIFQEPMTSLNPAFTVGDQIAETVRRHRGGSRRQAWDKAVQALSDVGIPAAERRARSYPHEFSGGMRQRVMIAMALSCEPSLLIADEPTTALDVTIQAQILDLLRDMKERLGMSMLFVTHDLGVVADTCDRVVVMYGGKVMEQSGVVDLFHRPAHPYTEGLLRSMPFGAGATARTASSRLYSIAGHPPIAGQFPDGCRFHPRCPYAADACRTGDVELVWAQPMQLSRCVRIGELTLAHDRLGAGR